MNELELYIIAGLNAVEGMKESLKHATIIPLGINPRINMIEQLLTTIQALLEEQNGEAKRTDTTDEQIHG